MSDAEIVQAAIVQAAVIWPSAISAGTALSDIHSIRSAPKSGCRRPAMHGQVGEREADRALPGRR